MILSILPCIKGICIHPVNVGNSLYLYVKGRLSINYLCGLRLNIETGVLYGLYNRVWLYLLSFDGEYFVRVARIHFPLFYSFHIIEEASDGPHAVTAVDGRFEL